MDEPTDEDMENAIGKEFGQLSNEGVVSNALEELNRVDIRDLDDDTIHAYGEALQAVVWLRECLTEVERRPNATISEPYGARNGGITDD